MSVEPSPSAPRGELSLQPSYFTSSLFVDPLREDMDLLASTFAASLAPLLHTRTLRHELAAEPSANVAARPFTEFKRIWEAQGWLWLNCIAFDARSRHCLLSTVFRLFVEKLSGAEPLVNRVAILFGLYTLYSSQLQTSSPLVSAVRHIDASMNHLYPILNLPHECNLRDEYRLFTPITSYIVHLLHKQHIFRILPASQLFPHLTRSLPRVTFRPEAGLPVDEGRALDHRLPKKRGRPRKIDVLKKTHEATRGLEQWLEDTIPESEEQSSAPSTLLAAYKCDKENLLQALDGGDDDDDDDNNNNNNNNNNNDSDGGQRALTSANIAMVARLRAIEEQAAEKGMEIGSEGGERTGMVRVERAFGELGQPTHAGGLLSMMEGAGLADDSTGTCT